MLVVKNVAVVDGTGCGARAGANLVMRNGTFDAVGTADADYTAPGDIVIDGTGAFAMPGLWESHTHLHLGSTFESIDAGCSRLEGVLRNYARGGITSVVELGGPIGLYNELRRRRTRAFGAQMYFAGPPFTGIDGWPVCVHHNHSFVREIASIEDGRAKLDAVVNTGVDVIKLMYDGPRGTPERLSLGMLRSLIVAAQEHGLRATVHVRTPLDALEAAESGADCIEHAVLLGEADEDVPIERLADALARHGTYYCPTLVLFEQIGRNGDISYLEELLREELLSPAEVEALLRPGSAFGHRSFPRHGAAECRRRLSDAQRIVLPAMRSAGVRLVAGSDLAVLMSRPAAFYRELQLLREAGLSSLDVLSAASMHAAARLGKLAAGTIARANSADAVIVRTDPAHDLLGALRRTNRITTICRGLPEPMTFEES
jgi:imidazolonepropionase-like amidohydrolase